jgi:EpsI family protein
MAAGMINRRDALIAAACVAAAGGAYALKPKNHVPLLTSGTLGDLVPTMLAGWTSQDISDPLALNQKDSLSARLYNELVVRLYTHESTQTHVVMLLAYGARQSDELQLHRPEVCYPAFGYTLTRNEAAQIPLGGRVMLPVRRLRAESPERRESIIYWSRLGEYLPQDGGAQRDARFRTALRGQIPDGLLSRFSSVSEDTAGAWASIQVFITTLLAAMPPAELKVLIGSDRARNL